jgi:dipeptidyl aminopeptidase/acylaminoacyl peptidase
MVADQRRMSADDLFSILIVGDARIHPDGQRVAFVQKRINAEKDEYETNIWIADGGECRQLTSCGKGSYPRWSPDGKFLAFLAKREEKLGIHLLPMAGGEARRISPENIDAGGFVWSPDGRRIVFSSMLTVDSDGRVIADDSPSGKDEKKKAPTKIIQRAAFKADGFGFVYNRRRHLHVLDVDSGRVTRLTEGDFHADAPAWSPDNKHIAYAAPTGQRWDVEMESSIWQISADGGEPVRLIQELGAWGRPEYSPDGRELLVAGIPMGEGATVTGFAKLWRMDRRGKDLRLLFDDAELDLGNSIQTDCKIETPDRAVWDEQGVWFIVSSSGSSRLMRWQDGLTEELGGQRDIRDFTVAGNSVAFTCADITHPAEIFCRMDGVETQLSDVNRPFLDSVRIVEPQQVHLRGSQGEDIDGWLFRPPDASAASPFVLYVHGGPQTAYGYSFFHEMQFLVAEGFGVLLTNPHGSSSHGEAFESSIHGQWGSRDFDDIMSAADYIETLDWVDSNRIAIAGGSYGGYMSSWAIGHTNRFAAAVIERSLVNMISFVGTTDIPNWWRYAWRTTVDKDPQALWSMSPLAYLAEMKTPSLIIHSEQDHRCPVEQGEQIFTGLRQMGVPTRFLRFPEESHGLSRGGKPSRRIERLNEIVRWLREYV